MADHQPRHLGTALRRIGIVTPIDPGLEPIASKPLPQQTEPGNTGAEFPRGARLPVAPFERVDGRRRVAVSLTPLPLEADSRAYRIASELADMGFRSVVIEGRASRKPFWRDGIDVHSLAAPPPNRVETGRRRGGRLRNGALGRVGELLLYAAFRGHDWRHHYRRALRVIPAADLYYLHSFEFHRAVAARAAGTDAAMIYDAHDFYRGIQPPEALPPFDRNRLRPFFAALENRLVAAADAVVTVSEGVAGLIADSCGRRPVVIRNSHDDRLDRAGAADLRMSLGLSARERLCVVVGNRKPGMAIGVAAEALALLSDHWHLAFVGRGYGAERERFRNHPATRRLHFGPHVAPDEVVPSIRSADLGLVIYEPYSENYRHALPNGFFQVVAAGLPVVRARLCEIEAVIGGRPVGLCLDRLNPAELAQAISACTEQDAVFRAEVARLASELSWECEAERLRLLVGGVLGERGDARHHAVDRRLASCSLAGG
jgi:glycosyltransferase involved in cell wall biosynthesis